MKNSRIRLFLVLLLGLIAGGAYFLWPQRATELVPVTSQRPAPQATAPAASPSLAPSVASASSAPAIAHPIDLIEPAPAGAAPALPALAKADSYVVQALGRLLGQHDLLTFLQGAGFVRRVVATVDNLPQSHASWTVWPVNRTPGRFSTISVGSDGSQFESISAGNAARYTPFVKFITSVDTAQAVALYVQLYPLFQQAYEELGYPGRYFNDRLVAVIDHLLATPTAPEPIQVKLVDVKGSVKSLQPWVRYEFADPALESLSAGQKLMLRIGAANHQRLNAKLRDIREKIAGGKITPKAATTQ